MQSKKNILFINTIKGWGGGEHWHFDWASRLQKEYNVFVIGNINSKLSIKAKEKGLNLFEIKLTNFSIFNPYKWFLAFKIISEIKPNSALLNLSRELKIFTPILKYFKTKKIIYRKGSSTPIKNNFGTNLILNYFVTDILCNSLATAEKSLIKYSNKDILAKIKIIYNSLDIEVYDNIKIKNLPKSDSFIIKSIGRFTPEKNQIIFFDLAKKLINKNINFEIHIAGTGADFEAYKEKLKEEKLEKYIKLHGFVENTKEFLSNCDVFILPSKWEGFGFVKLEAMAMSIPIIAFNNSSNPETIIDHNTGYLIPENNLEIMAEKVELLCNDPELKINLGKNNRKYLEREFDIKINKEKIISLID